MNPLSIFRIFRPGALAAVLGGLLVTPALVAQTPGSVTLTATINDTGGSRSPEHYAVVWVTTETGVFIKTLWKQGPTSFTSSQWTAHCPSWKNARGTSVAIDGVSSATAFSYAPPDSPIIKTWNCLDASTPMALVPDGNYKFWIQYCDDDSVGPVTTSGLTWTKGPSAYSSGSLNQAPNFTNMSIVWTPTVVAAPEIAVEQPVATDIADGGTKDFGSVVVGTPASLTFTIKNVGTAALTGFTITKDGSNPADFTVTAPVVSSVAAAGSTTFSVSFNPAAAGVRSAAIHIANNDSNENPFDITLTGTAITAYTSWASVLPPGQSGPGQTPQNDGVTNLMKFACNMDPSKPDVRMLAVGGGGTAGLPGQAMVGGKLRLEFLRRKAGTNPGITYKPQFCSNLGAWVDFTDTENVTSIGTPADPTWERVTVDDPIGGAARFGRLVIVQP